MRAAIVLNQVSCLLALACGCAPAPRPAAAPALADVEAAIARVEHGLIPEVRVSGERGGWSIEERLRAHHTPAVSVAVIHNHRVAWARAWGKADLRTGERATENTLFQAASVSKLVTAMAALQAVESGRVSLDADINQALRSWQLPANDLTRATPVTLRRLLSHTAGINLRSVLGYYEEATLPTLHQILDGQPPADTAPIRAVQAPGKEFRYSGGGLIIVQQLLVDLAGRPFAEAMHDSVFAPLGLAHTSFALRPAREGFAIAAAHDFDQTLLRVSLHPESAAAGLWSTPADLARFLVEIQLGLEGRSQRISKTLATRLTTPVAPIGVPDVDIALGAFVDRHAGVAYFGHDGHNDGFLTIARASKTKGEGAVVMVNGVAGTPLLLEVLRSIAAEYAWDGWLAPPITLARVAPAELAALAGRYVGKTDQAIAIAVRGDRLEARRPFQEPLELLPTGGDVFVSRADGTRFTFRKNAAGQLELSSAPREGEPSRFARLAEGAPEPLELLDAGRFDEALARYRELVAANPKDPAVAESRFDDLGIDLLWQRLDFERAIRVFRVEAALYPESAGAAAALADAWLRAGRRAEAAPVYARAIALFARDTQRTEVEALYLRYRMERLKNLAARELAQ